MSWIKDGMSESEFSLAYDNREEELKNLKKEQLAELVMVNEFEAYVLKKLLDSTMELMDKDLKRTKFMAIGLCIVWVLFIILLVIRNC